MVQKNYDNLIGTLRSQLSTNDYSAAQGTRECLEVGEKEYGQLIEKLKTLQSKVDEATWASYNRHITRLAKSQTELRLARFKVDKSFAGGLADGFVEPTVGDKALQPQLLSTMSQRPSERADVISRLETRTQQLRRIENDMADLGTTFVLLDDLVQQQGNQVGEIEMRGKQVVENAKSANNELDRALIAAQRRRRMKLFAWIIGIGLVVTGITFGVVFAVQH